MAVAPDVAVPKDGAIAGNGVYSDSFLFNAAFCNASRSGIEVFVGCIP